MNDKQKIAILGSGNIGTDLLMKIMREAKYLEVGAMAGVDPNSEGLARASSMGIPTTHHGLAGLMKLPHFHDIRYIFDATSASAHHTHHQMLKQANLQIIDLTPAAVGPFVVPSVNLEEHLTAKNVNMVTCGGQATIPIVAAISQVAKVHYAEIIASISSRSAGLGTRANIDEFTETTARGLEIVGGATRGKAIIILNPAEPPPLMRDTVFCLSEMAAQDRIVEAVQSVVKNVQQYVPGFRLKQDIQFEVIHQDRSVLIPGLGKKFGLKTSVFLEVEGSADYLPSYAGNLDIMTSAALGTAERIAQSKLVTNTLSCSETLPHVH